MTFALAALAAPARAQTDTARLDSARVTLEPLTITATRVPAPRTKIGSALTVVTSEMLRREPPRFASDALARLVGVSLDESNGPGGPTIVRLRGGEEVFGQILVDGVQVNQNGGFFDFQGLQLTNVDRIEVARGPQSALYGSTAVNGVVHFITRAGEPGASRVSAELTGGDAGREGGSVRATVAAHGGSRVLRYSAGAGFGYERGIFAVPHDIKSREGSLRLDAALRPTLDVTAVARFVAMDAHLPVRDPGATRVPLDPNARNGRDRLVSSLHATVRAGALAHRAGASVYWEAFEFEDQRDGVSDPNFFIFDADFTLDSRLTRTVLDYQGTLVTALGAAPVTVAFGMQGEREALRDRTGGDFGSDTLALGRNAGAVYAEVGTSLGGRVHALLGGRAEAVEDLETQISPRATLLAELTRGGALSLRAAVGRAFKAPNLQQQYLDNPFILSNPDLRPETSWSWELGVRFRPRTNVELEASVFRQDYRDLIRTVQSSSDSTRQINLNIGTARAWGVEHDAALALPGGVRAGLNATVLTTRVLENTGLNPAEYPLNEPLPFRPAVTAGALFVTPVGPRVEVALRLAVVGSQVVLSERFSGRRVSLPAYGLAGATLTARLSGSLDAFARIDNLLDQYYETGYDRRGLPRVWTLGLRWGE